MNIHLPAPSQTESLPSLIRRAADQLASATTAAEVLEARDAASVAYDAAKKAARFAKAKGAHDELIAKAHRAQADALEIEATAKRRLADEYDAAQERGEVAKPGGERSGREHSLPPPTAADIGLTRKDIHDARQIRDAEAADPGIVRRTLDERLAAKEEPTKAALRQSVMEAARIGLRGGGESKSRRNPTYQPDAKWDAMLAVSAGCRAILEKAGHLDPEFILGGFVDDGQRERNLATIRQCRDFLSRVLEYADAE